MARWLATLALLIAAFALLAAGCGGEGEDTASAPAGAQSDAAGEGGGEEGTPEGSTQAQGKKPKDAEALCARTRNEMLAQITKVVEKYGTLSRDKPQNGVKAAQQAVVPTLDAMLQQARELESDRQTEEVFTAIDEATEEVDERNLSTQVPAFQEAFEPSSELAREAGLEACAFVS